MYCSREISPLEIFWTISSNGYLYPLIFHPGLWKYCVQRLRTSLNCPYILGSIEILSLKCPLMSSLKCPQCKFIVSLKCPSPLPHFLYQFRFCLWYIIIQIWKRGHFIKFGLNDVRLCTTFQQIDNKIKE